MNNNPKISVVMSAYNRPQYVKDAIESILNQTYKDFEFIIIDDCSTDNTADVIQEYANKDNRIVFIRNKKNMDYNYNLRKGFDIARGEYIARMDDDDISMPTRFEKQVKFLDENPEITVLGTFIETFGDPDARNWVSLTDSDELAIAMNFYNPMCHPSVMIRKSFLKEHNLNYSPKELYAEEYHLWKEIILRGGRLANLPEILVRYRCHKKSVTQASKTSKIQDKTAERVREDLLSRFYNNKKEVKKIRKSIFKCPFEFNKKKEICNALETMKQHPNTIPIDAINRFEEKFCGKPCTMDIFFASNDKFAQHLCTSIASILKNAVPFDYHKFYILDGGISNKNKEKITLLKKIKDFEIEFIEISEDLFESCPITPACQYISKQTYYRYIIPRLKPELEKVMYLDCDIIVEDSLNSLWNITLEDNYVAAVEELCIQALDTNKKLEIDKSFNAGILLINNKKWCIDNISDLLFQNTDFLAKQDKITWVDQCVLNYTFYNKVKFIEPKYNVQESIFYMARKCIYTDKQLQQAGMAPIIIHYNSPIKPWDKNSNHPLWKEYFKYLKFTPYKNQYYKYKVNKFLKEFGRIFYHKKKTGGKTKIKIFGIPVYKKTNWNYTKKKYLFGIRFYKKKDNFALLNDKLNNITNTQLQNQLQMQKLAYAINNKVSKSLAVYNLHQKVFPKYKNINKGRDVAIVATGPSLNDYIPINNAIYIGVNKAFQYNKIKFDYLFLQDYSGLTKSFIEDFLHYNTDSTNKFIGFINNDEYPTSIIPDKYSDFKNVERYYTLNPNILNQFNYDISCHAFAEFNSIVFPAMQFILWTNPKRIYLVGCDCSLNGYYNSKDKNNLATQKVIEGWKKLKEFAQIYYPDTEIISINPVSLKGIFKDQYQKEVPNRLTNKGYGGYET